MSDYRVPVNDFDKMNLNHLASEVGRLFKGKGFALLVFSFEATGEPMLWISNAQRESMVLALKEFIHNQSNA